MTIALTNSVPRNYSQSEWVAIITRMESAINATFQGTPSGRLMLSAAPTTGSWALGSLVWNSAPSAGGTIGWVCVAAGSPGTWKAWGSIAA